MGAGLNCINLNLINSTFKLELPNVLILLSRGGVSSSVTDLSKVVQLIFIFWTPVVSFMKQGLAGVANILQGLSFFSNWPGTIP